MTTHASSAPVPRVRRRPQWPVPAGLILLSLIPVIAGAARLTELTGGAAITAQNARFFASPVPVVTHILSVTTYSLLGAFQFLPALRGRRGWHRIAGRILAPAGLLAALSGLWMAVFYPLPPGDGPALLVLRLVFGSAMAASIVLGVVAVVRRDFVRHGAWMTRGYAIGVAAGTQALTGLPWMLLVGPPDEPTRAVLLGAAWVINLAVAEYVIHRRARRTVRVRALADGRGGAFTGLSRRRPSRASSTRTCRRRRRRSRRKRAGSPDFSGEADGFRRRGGRAARLTRMTIVDDQGRPEPPLASDETATLLGFLDYQRATLAWKCAGLDAAGFVATTAASSMTLGGLLKHMAYVESEWFSRSLHARDREAPFAAVDWKADPGLGVAFRRRGHPGPAAHPVAGRRGPVPGPASRRPWPAAAWTNWPVARGPTVRHRACAGSCAT